MPFWDIINCPRIAAARQGHGPCATVVASQGNAGHLPEPWVGHLETAPILFISSNPGFDAEEHFPTADWPRDQVEEFFTDRFSAGDPRYVVEFRVRHAGGGRAGRAPQYWSEVDRCAFELLGRRRPAGVEPGIDYALTEVVHCKSRGNQGTAEAANSCADRYLQRVLAASDATVLVCYGDTVWPQVRRVLGLPVAQPPANRVALVGPIPVAGKERMLLFLPQPGSSRPRRPSVVLDEAQMEQLRAFAGA